MRQLTNHELESRYLVRDRSLALEAETGADSVATIERVYDRSPSGAYRCVMPGCKVARHDAEQLWRHVHGPAHR